MPEVDVSSYKTPDAPNPLDIAGKLGTMQLQKGAIEKQGIGIEQDKLKLYNERHGIFNREMSNLIADPDVINGTPNAPAKVMAAGQRMVNLGLIPAPMFAEYVKAIPTDPKAIPQYVQGMITRSKGINDAVNYHFGEPGTIDTGQTIQPVVTSNKPGFGGVRSSGLPIQRQNPVGTTVVGPDNVPTLLGPQPPQLPDDGSSVAAPPPMNLLPVQPQQPVVGQKLMEGKDGARVQNRLPVKPTGPSVGMTPLFDEGKKKFVEDNDLATNLLQQNKSAEQALPLIKDLTTGVGTETYNKALAGLHNLGWLGANMTDKVAAYQEANKKLSLFVQNNGTRSDADLAKKEESNPNIKQQINPALIKLTKDAIILNRVQAARGMAFESQKFDEYHRHRATFSQTVDERAFGLDFMDDKERNALILKMDKQLRSDKASEVNEAKKFRKSLGIVERLGIF